MKLLILLITLALSACNSSTSYKAIQAAQKACKPNGGLNYLDRGFPNANRNRVNAYCINGAKFTITIPST